MEYDFDKILKEAGEIAEKAGKEKLIELQNNGYQFAVVDGFTKKTIDRLLDVCGCAGVYFKDKRGSFYRKYKQYLISKNPAYKDSDINSFYYNCNIHRQEYSVNKVEAIAVCNYLNKNYNANVYSRAWID